MDPAMVALLLVTATCWAADLSVAAAERTYEVRRADDEIAIDRLPQTNRTLFLKLGYALVL